MAGFSLKQILVLMGEYAILLSDMQENSETFYTFNFFFYGYQTERLSHHFYMVILISFDSCYHDTLSCQAQADC